MFKCSISSCSAPRCSINSSSRYRMSRNWVITSSHRSVASFDTSRSISVMRPSACALFVASSPNCHYRLAAWRCSASTVPTLVPKAFPAHPAPVELILIGSRAKSLAHRSQRSDYQSAISAYPIILFHRPQSRRVQRTSSPALQSIRLC